jgi:CelD/BcsL family acetyltransferase involved in cellulose biosynthesis
MVTRSAHLTSAREEDASPPKPTTIRLYDRLEALDDLLPAWEDLLSACPDASIFSTWEWLSSWWVAFGSQLRLHVVGMWSQDGQLQALAPMAVGKDVAGFGIELAALQLMADGSGDSDGLGFLVRPGFEEVFAEALLGHLERHPVRWDIATLNTVDPRVRWIEALRAALARRRWTTITLSRPWCVVPLPCRWEDYLASLSPKERRKIGARTRRLTRHHEVSCRVCGDPAELDAWLDVLFDLHSRRWQTVGRTGSFQSPQRRQFYRTMASRFLTRGWLDFSQLLLNRRVAATQFSFRYRSTEYSLQEGYDPACASDSVGYVLRAFNLKRLIAEGVERYDFLGGSDGAKKRWGARDGHYIDIHFARRPSLGALHLAGKDGALRLGRWLKRRFRPAR